MLAFCAQLVTAREINVAEHGIVPGQDVTIELNQLIDSVAGEENITLKFPKGTYDFYPDNAFEIHRAVANHDNGLKRMAFQFFDHKNITVDGSGSKFIFHGHMIPFTLESVEGANLKNFSIDWVRSFHAELECIERNEKDKSAVFKIDQEKYPHFIEGGELKFQRYLQVDPIGSNMVWDPKTRSPIYDYTKYSIKRNSAKVTKPGKNLVKFEKAFKEQPPVGSILVVYGVHPTSRLAPAIHITNSKDIQIENVTVYEAGGMALIVERTENISLNRMIVSSNEERIVATRADATHFIGCKGTITLENCLFQHMLDDGINVHGAYVPISKYIGDNQFLCEISHFQQWGLTFGEPGDKVALLSRTTILPFFETEITNIKKLNEKRFILTVSDLPKQLPEGPLSVENLTWYPDLVMRNNTIRENRARSVLVTTKGNVLIENNYFSSQMHGILIEGDNNKWYESGAVQDVVIRNNVFENIGYSLREAYPLLASPLLKADQHMGEGQYHRNIRFVDNTLKSFTGQMVKAQSVQGLEITGNKIEFSTYYPAHTQGAAIDLNYCDAVTIDDNTAEGFDNEIGIEKTDDSTRIAIKQNTGF